MMLLALRNEQTAACLLESFMTTLQSGHVPPSEVYAF
jgi:hypothetical protein